MLKGGGAGVGKFQQTNNDPTRGVDIQSHESKGGLLINNSNMRFAPSSQIGGPRIPNVFPTLVSKGVFAFAGGRQTSAASPPWPTAY